MWLCSSTRTVRPMKDGQWVVGAFPGTENFLKILPSLTTPTGCLQARAGPSTNPREAHRHRVPNDRLHFGGGHVLLGLLPSHHRRRLLVVPALQMGPNP